VLALGDPASEAVGDFGRKTRRGDAAEVEAQRLRLFAQNL
jgi:hypothetical protein